MHAKRRKERSPYAPLRVCIAGVLVLAGGGAVLRLVWSSVSTSLSRLVDRPLDGWLLRDVVSVAALGTAAIAILVLIAGGVATALTALPLVGRTHRCAHRVSRLAPPTYRRWVLAACGTALTVPLATGIAAADDHLVDHHPTAVTDRSALAGLPLPDLPAAPLGPTDTVTVRSGDSLWSISARLIGPGAEPDEIARGVTELYRLNLEVIGPDPNLIFPGTQLTTGGTR